MRRLNVSLKERSYDILIGGGLLANPALFMPLLGSNRVVLVTNETVGAIYRDAFEAGLSKLGIGVVPVSLRDGEAFKTWDSLNTIHDAMLEARCDRATTVLALGGGVVGDLAGFAAATYQRGVPFMQFPTTLLSQVDSSVGGKTGINHPRGKNMIGAFWQPRLVIADTDTLNTLPERELAAGMAEVIKYGLIRDLAFLEWLEANLDRLMARDGDCLAEAIERSCANKAEVVAADELETAKDDGRALLNLGHTFGHAIETGMGYGEWLHGEAVAAGMVMAAELSCRIGWLARADVDRTKTLLLRAKLPVHGPRLGAPRYLELMAHDKKVISGKLRLVLLRRLGEAATFAGSTPEQIAGAIDACCDA